VTKMAPSTLALQQCGLWEALRGRRVVRVTVRPVRSPTNATSHLLNWLAIRSEHGV
jgi:hypothetical protein